ncbi:proline utilization trans-activator [Microdochium trichocladiopsis]|uniref:Proline utilization trans-activator n=1 Tax=Microdochium trichocladiopsis TaxID=1682393 RepID=A0A9P8Y4X2_9PEZI|nr:proline utilization trans-activator [Microdochium trichocladiopsis]KAH7029793.1 proline utilization trans-activator [Microdochium trichocladiopsis]
MPHPPDVPCQNCVSASTSCTFPARDRNIIVSENYVRSLQARLETAQSCSDVSTTPAEGLLRGLGRPKHGTSAAKLSFEHATSEAFVSGLKKAGTLGRDSDAANEAIPGSAQLGADMRSTTSRSGRSDNPSQYDYVALEFDTSATSIAIQLPPFPYATQLVQQFESYMGYEYHWFLRREFHATLEETYRFPDSPRSRNRIWLCKLLAVLALGESYNSHKPPLIDLTVGRSCARDREGPSEHAKTPYIPGAEFFEQALSLFKMPTEEPSIEHVEALNLITFFSYSLNRRKTAFMYAGMSMRIACTLMLHKPAGQVSAPAAEHQKRVWWTTYLLDSMTSLEMGIRATFGALEAEQSQPSDEQLSKTDQDDFWDAQILTAHLNLDSARRLVLETVGLLHDADFAGFKRAIEVPLQELEKWRLALPNSSSFDFSSGIPEAMLEQPSMRSLASLFLRFHQSYILLTRPVFFKVLGLVMGKDKDTSALDDLIALSSQCLEAAKCNMRILTELSSRDKLAKYGFYDAMHLFSAINIFSLTSLVNAVRPLSLTQDAKDLALHCSARQLLMTMASCGNLASKGYVQMLEEIERIADVVSLQSQQNGGSAPASFGDEIFPWIDSIDTSGFFLDTVGYL